MASPLEVLKPLKGMITPPEDDNTEDVGASASDGRMPKKKKVNPIPEKEGGFTGGKSWPIKSKEGVK
jgi:hypothetical protein